MVIKEFSEQLLPAAAKLCRRSMELDIMPDFILREKTFFDKDFRSDLTLCYFEDNTEPISGFIQGVVRKREEEKIGYIKLFCVDSNLRRRGIGQKLHDIIVEKMKSAGIKTVRVYESFPNYLMPGIDKNYIEAVSFFEKNGYTKFNETCNLTAELAHQNFDTVASEKKLNAEGIIFRRAEEKDKENIAAFIFKHFRAWLEEVYQTFKREPVTLFLAEKDGKIIGFSAFEGNNKGMGWFGPMGTDETFRGKGIGGILLKKTLLEMKIAGYPKAIIPWVGPVKFYTDNCNCKIDRVFLRYEKKLE